MAFPLTVLAADTAHGTEETTHAAGEAGLLQQFGIEGPFLLSQIISFCVVIFVLYKFAFKPVLATIEERKAKIASGLRYSEEMKAKLADAESQHQETLQKASLEAQRIVGEARSVAEDKIAKASHAAAARAEAIVAAGESQIELDRKAMLAEARAEIARLVVATTSKVLGKDLSAEEKSRYNDSAGANLVDARN